MLIYKRYSRIARLQRIEVQKKREQERRRQEYVLGLLDDKLQRYLVDQIRFVLRQLRLNDPPSLHIFRSYDLYKAEENIKHNRITQNEMDVIHLLHNLKENEKRQMRLMWFSALTAIVYGMFLGLFKALS